MLNMIRMNILRMFKSKSTYVLLIVGMICAGITVYACSFEQDYYSEHPEQYAADMAYLEEAAEDDSATIGITVETNMDYNHKYTIAEIFDSHLASALPYIMLAIFAVLFVNAEHTSGFEKSISGQVTNRGLMFVSKIPSLVIFTLLNIVTVIGALAVSFSMFFDYFKIGPVKNMLETFGLQFLMSFAFALTIAFITAAVRSSAIAMTIAICTVSGVTQMIYMVINYLLNKIDLVGESFNLANYTVTGNISSMISGVSGNYLTRGLVVGVCFIIFSTVAATFITKKRDI